MRTFIERLENGGDGSGGGKMNYSGSGNDPDTIDIRN